MNWAYEQRWSSVRVQGKMLYAIYGDEENWITSLMVGNQDMITALYETLIECRRSPVGSDEHRDASDRVRASIIGKEEDDRV